MYFKKISTLASRALFAIFKTYSFLFPCAILFLLQDYPILEIDHIRRDLQIIISQSKLDTVGYTNLREAILQLKFYSISSFITLYILFFLTIIQIVINITVLLFLILKNNSFYKKRCQELVHRLKL